MGAFATLWIGAVVERKALGSSAVAKLSDKKCENALSAKMPMVKQFFCMRAFAQLLEAIATAKSEAKLLLLGCKAVSDQHTKQGLQVHTSVQQRRIPSLVYSDDLFDKWPPPAKQFSSTQLLWQLSSKLMHDRDGT